MYDIVGAWLALLGTVSLSMSFRRKRDSTAWWIMVLVVLCGGMWLTGPHPLFLATAPTLLALLLLNKWTGRVTLAHNVFTWRNRDIKRLVWTACPSLAVFFLPGAMPRAYPIAHTLWHLGAIRSSYLFARAALVRDLDRLDLV